MSDDSTFEFLFEFLDADNTTKNRCQNLAKLEKILAKRNTQYIEFFIATEDDSSMPTSTLRGGMTREQMRAQAMSAASEGDWRSGGIHMLVQCLEHLQEQRRLKSYSDHEGTEFGIPKGNIDSEIAGISKIVQSWVHCMAVNAGFDLVCKNEDLLRNLFILTGPPPRGGLRTKTVRATCYRILNLALMDDSEKTEGQSAAPSLYMGQAAEEGGECELSREEIEHILEMSIGSRNVMKVLREGIGGNVRFWPEELFVASYAAIDIEYVYSTLVFLNALCVANCKQCDRVEMGIDQATEEELELYHCTMDKAYTVGVVKEFMMGKGMQLIMRQRELLEQGRGGPKVGDRVRLFDTMMFKMQKFEQMMMARMGQAQEECAAKGIPFDPEAVMKEFGMGSCRLPPGHEEEKKGETRLLGTPELNAIYDQIQSILMDEHKDAEHKVAAIAEVMQSRPEVPEAPPAAPAAPAAPNPALDEAHAARVERESAEAAAAQAEKDATQAARDQLKATLDPPDAPLLAPPDMGLLAPPGGDLLAPPDMGLLAPPGGDLLAPPGGLLAPPGGDLLAPPGGLLAPPGGDLLAPPGGLLAPPGGLLAPPGGLLAPPGGLLAPPGGLLAPPGGGLLAPPGGLLAPPGGGLLAPPGGGLLAPPGGGLLAPPGGGLLAAPGGLLAAPGGLMPPPGGLMPPGGMRRGRPRKKKIPADMRPFNVKKIRPQEAPTSCFQSNELYQRRQAIDCGGEFRNGFVKFFKKKKRVQRKAAPPKPKFITFFAKPDGPEILLKALGRSYDINDLRDCVGEYDEERVNVDIISKIQSAFPSVEEAQQMNEYTGEEEKLDGPSRYFKQFMAQVPMLREKLQCWVDVDAITETAGMLQPQLEKFIETLTTLNTSTSFVEFLHYCKFLADEFGRMEIPGFYLPPMFDAMLLRKEGSNLLTQMVTHLMNNQVSRCCGVICGKILPCVETVKDDDYTKIEDEVDKFNGGVQKLRQTFERIETRCPETDKFVMKLRDSLMTLEDRVGEMQKLRDDADDQFELLSRLFCVKVPEAKTGEFFKATYEFAVVMKEIVTKIKLERRKNRAKERSAEDVQQGSAMRVLEKKLDEGSLLMSLMSKGVLGGAE